MAESFEDKMIGDSDPLLNGSNGGLTTVEVNVNVEPEPEPVTDDDDDSDDYSYNYVELGSEWGQFLSQPTENQGLGGFEISVGAEQTLPATSLPLTEQNNVGLLGHRTLNEANELEMEDSVQEEDDQCTPDSRIESCLEDAGNGEISDYVPVPVPVAGPSSSFAASQLDDRRAGKNATATATAKVTTNKKAEPVPKTKTSKKTRTGTQHEAFVRTGSEKHRPAYKAKQNREKKKKEKERLEAHVASLQEENDSLKTQLNGNVEVQEIQNLRAENTHLKTQLNGNVQVQKNEYLEEENNFLRNRIKVVENENVGHKRDKNLLQAQVNGLEQENKSLHVRIQKLLQQNNPPN